MMAHHYAYIYIICLLMLPSPDLLLLADEADKIKGREP
jgi:hypothetical protein